MYALPRKGKLRAEYERSRAEDLKAERGPARATAFYAADGEAMDEGVWWMNRGQAQATG